MSSYKKHLLSLVFLLLVSLFASQKLFSPLFYTSHDGGGHVIRMEEFHEALSDGQFPVRLAKRVNYGLGYPFFNFNYPLIYYAGEGVHRLGFSYVDSFKLLMISSIILGAFSMYLLTNLYFGSVASVVSSIFFTIAPYKFLNMYVRGNVAESIGLALVPLLILSIEYFVRKKDHSFIFLILVSSTLILSHNISTVIGLSLGFAYLLFKIIKNKKKVFLFRQFIVSIFISSLLTAFFWVPLVVESQATKLVDLQSDYVHFFPTLREIIYSPWGFGAYMQGNIPGKMSPQIGLVHVTVFLVALMIFIIKVAQRKKFVKKDLLVMFFIAVSFISIFLAIPLSKIIWDSFSPLQYVQIPWRFVGYITLGTAIMAGFLIDKIKEKKFQLVVSVFLILIVFYANRNHIRVNQYIDYESPFSSVQIYGPSTTSKDEHMPRLAPHIFTVPNQSGDLIPKQNGKSERLVWKSNYHKFVVDLKSDAQFRDNTSYFPGWVALVDGRKTELLYKNDEFYRLRVQIGSGRHTIEYFFTEPWYRAIPDSASVLTLLLGSIYVVRRHIYNSTLV